MAQHPVMSKAEFRSLLSGIETRANRGRPGNWGKESKRVYKPIPNTRQIAALLFYREPYKEREKINKFFDEYGIQPFSPVEVTPAFFRYRVKKVANFDKDTLETFRIEASPDVLVITGVLLTEEQKKASGRKATAYVPRARTLKAAGLKVVTKEERKELEADIEKLDKRMTALLKKRNDTSSATVTESEVNEFRRILKKKENKELSASQVRSQYKKSPILQLIIDEVKTKLEAAKAKLEASGGSEAQVRQARRTLTTEQEEMVADLAKLTKYLAANGRISQESVYSQSDARSYFFASPDDFAATLAQARELTREVEAKLAAKTDEATGPAAGRAPTRGRSRGSRAGTSSAPTPSPVVVTTPPSEAASEEAQASALTNINELSEADGRKVLKAIEKAVKDGQIAEKSDDETRLFVLAAQGDDAASMILRARILAKIAKDNDGTLQDQPDSMLEQIIEMETLKLGQRIGSTPRTRRARGAAGGEAETQENPRRRRPRTALVPARTAAKWLKLKAVADKVDAAYHKMSKSYEDLRKLADLLGRLKRKRSAQADYARDQIQAEQTRVERRLVKETAAYKKAQATYLKAIKVANKKPAKKRRSR